MTWRPIPGETPIDPSGLRPELRRTVHHRAELAVVEARNVNRAFLRYLAAVPTERIAPFNFDWFLQLHEEMFGEVWTWAGRVRTIDLNLGAPHHLVIERLAGLVDDLHSWSGFGHAVDRQAVWLHHRSVSIHPFLNGNGRWARLLANVWLARYREPIVAWPEQTIGSVSTVREEYLAAVRAAHRGDDEPLATLHQRFRDVP